DAARQLGSELGSRFRPGGRPASRAGEELERAHVLGDALSGHGYQPRQGDDGVIRLRNCPFHQLAEHHRDIVCGMNLGLIQGIVAGLGLEDMHPVLDPQPRHCCVAIGVDQP
ncbi:MAG TPA: hypothetical protein VED20_15965, partial [Streptosporangiaceae bacterium]|nr:hypothetical protein [Streptosporangiaceae bacterium]